MSSNSKTTVIAILALIVGAAAGAGFGMMQVDEVTQKLVMTMQERDQVQQSADRLRKMTEEATRKYGRELGRLVAAAGALVVSPPPTPAAPAPSPDPSAAPAPAPAPVADDAAKLLDHARAILAARDGFRAALDGARASMNSELDALAAELGNPAADAMKVKQIIDALKQNWPDKEKGMTEATRKLLADLGVLPMSAAAKPAAPAAPEPAEKK